MSFPHDISDSYSAGRFILVPFLVLWLTIPCHSAPDIISFGNGVLSWEDNATNGFHSIQWSSSALGPWSSDWNQLKDIPAIPGTNFANIPMFFRVFWNSVPLSGNFPLILPEVSSFTATGDDGSVGLSWVNPASTNYSGVRIVRSSSWYPSTPFDGALIFQGVASSFLNAPVNNGTRYYYTAFTYNSLGTYSFGANATALPQDTTPPSPITNFSATPSDRSVSLTWINPSDPSFVGLVVVRSTTAPPATPSGGTSVYNGNGTSHIDSNLNNNVTYYYRVFAFDDVPNFSASTFASATPINIFPPPNITTLTSTSADKRVTLNWSNPSTGDFLGVRIQRKVGSVPTNYLDGTTVYEGNARGFTNTPLVNGLNYYYRIFSYDEIPNYSDGVVTNGVPHDLVAPGNPSSFIATPAAGFNNLRWNLPQDADLAGVTIVRNTSTQPINPSDGTVIYTGFATNFNDSPALIPGATNFYRIFAFDEATNYSSGISATISPPNRITSFVAATQDEAVRLSWSNPGGSFSGVLIRGSTNSFPSNPTDGNFVYQGSDTSTTNINLTNGIVYYYSAFSYDISPNYSAASTSSATPADTNAPSSVTALSVSPSNTALLIQWSNPSTPDLDHIRIQRALSVAPTSITSGVTVFTGLATQYYDTGLFNGSNYVYSVYAADEVPNYSLRASVTGEPLRQLFYESFEDATGWSDQLGTNWVVNANSGTWSSDFVRVASDASLAASGNRYLIVTNGCCNGTLYLPTATGPVEVRLSVRSKTPSTYASISLQHWSGLDWYTLTSRSITTGLNYSNVTLRVNLPNLPAQRLRLLIDYYGEALVDDIELRVAP